MAPKPKVGDVFEVEAYPAKAFFVDMITRDIALQDAILDLLDNCIDGIRRVGAIEGAKPYKGYFSHITFNEKEFIIEDNCGGIPLDVARQYAFMMGRPANRDTTLPKTIGVYGIGMKRAIFKMGRSCVVHSNHQKHTFDVEIDKDWMRDDTKWDLEAVLAKPRISHNGTKIEVRELHSSIKEFFAEGSSFRATFDEVVGAAYSFLIDKGFEIKINGTKIKYDLPKLLWTDSSTDEGIKPYIYEGVINNVNVFLAVGFRERPKTAEDDDSEEAMYKSEDAGWSIVCNDRVVLTADRSRITGWGYNGVPSYHTQFIAISGFVMFDGNARDLPMNTTKRGVDANSEVYSIVRERMQQGLKYFTKFTNDWKGQDTQQIFKDTKPFSITQVHNKAKAVKKTNLSVGQQMQPNLPKKPRDTTHKRISFKRPIAEIETLKLFFDTPDASASQIGEYCFEFAHEEAK